MTTAPARRPARVSLAGFRPSGFFVFRTALLPFDELLTWAEGTSAPGAAPEALAVAWQDDMTRLRAGLRERLARPEIREAIYLASPVLAQQIGLWLADPLIDPGERLVRSAVRYFMRMAGRPTPFGLFAGNSRGRLGEELRLELAPRAAYRRRTRIDHDYLGALVQAFGADPGLRRELTYRPNSSLYEAHGQLRYAESRVHALERQYHLVTADLDEPLVSVLTAAGPGAPYAALVDTLIGPDIERAEAEAYVGELIDAQILVAELEPPLTGPDPLRALTATLAATHAGRAWSDRLAALESGLAALDAGGLGRPPDDYAALAEPLTALPAVPEPGRLFQVDMAKPAPGATLPTVLLDDLDPALELLLRLAARTRRRTRDAFHTFRRQFEERYGQREMPLLEVLDEELGIGFLPSTSPTAEPSPLLQGLPFGDAPAAADLWTAEEEFILPQLGEALSSGAREIELSAAALPPEGPGERARLPDAFSLVLKLHAADSAAVARGEYRVTLKYAVGPSGARLLGRFCHMDDPLCAEVRTHLAEEQALAPDAIYAEVVHLPQGRTGNVLARPVLRDWELPFLGRSGAAPERQIPLQDLRISVAGERIVLRSARLNRQVIPRLSTAHNFLTQSLGIYHFLCRLQTPRGETGLTWSWGRFEALPFLPALRLGCVWLSAARWRLNRAIIERLTRGDGVGRFAAVQRQRAESGWPRFVGLVDDDNVLPADLDNALSVDTLLDLIEGRPECVLRELESSPVELPVSGPEGRFASEFVVPLVRVAPAESVQAAARVATSAPAEAESVPRHGPGSSWVYLKLYAGPAVVDRLLRDEVPALIDNCGAAGALERWFFIRYNDPEHHLRLRLCAHSPEAQPGLRARVEVHFAAALAAGRVWRIQLDTYDPEQVRYGGAAGLEPAERLFRADSEAVLRLLALTRGDEGMDLRWRLCLAGLDRLLADFGFEMPARLRVMTRLAARFDREFRVEGGLKHAVRDRFRALRDPLTRIVGGDPELSEEIRAGLAILDRRSRDAAPALVELRGAAEAGLLNQPLEDLAGSHLHMHANRMMRAAPRAQEMMLYHFLERIYRSVTARAGRAPEEGARR